MRIVADGVVMQTAGEVADSAREYARRQVMAFLRRLRGRLNMPSPSARLKLTVFARPSGRLPALPQVNLDMGGQQVRAQTAAAFVHEASRRLREQLARLTSPDVPRPWPVTGRVDLEALTVAVGRREIVRRKLCAPARCTPDRAALTMDVMDYRCHLFIDADTGQDSVIYRFFRDSGTGRGAVFYRRYDGHYGLIAPEASGGC